MPDAFCMHAHQVTLFFLFLFNSNMDKLVPTWRKINLPKCSFFKKIYSSLDASATLFCCWGSLGAVGLHLESGTRFSSSAGNIGAAVDTVGAGDTFIAGIILALGVRGYDIGRGLRFACELASQKCSQYGFKRLLQAIPPDL